MQPLIGALPESMGDAGITLRRYRYEDAAALLESTTVSHEHLRGYMPFAAELPTDGSVADFIRASVDRFRNDGNANYAITRTDDDAYLGSCGIHDRVGAGALEIGYWVDVRYVRCGIATAAARLLTDACFDVGADRVVIRCDVTNEASAAVARRLGYELDEVRPCEAIAPSQTGEEMVWVKRRHRLFARWFESWETVVLRFTSISHRRDHRGSRSRRRVDAVPTRPAARGPAGHAGQAAVLTAASIAAMERAARLFAFDERPSDSLYVSSFWATTSVPDPSFMSTAASGWEMVVTRQTSGIRMTVRGPETYASPAGIPVAADFFGIRFTSGTFMPDIPLRRLVDRDVDLPPAGANAFWLDGWRWRFPDFDDADDFVERLVRRGLLVHDDVAAAALRGDVADLSARSVQRRIVRATGLPHRTIRSIDRAQQAVGLLDEGHSIGETIWRTGYADQAHMTRALRRFAGQTPAQIARRAVVASVQDRVSGLG